MNTYNMERIPVKGVFPHKLDLIVVDEVTAPPRVKYRMAKYSGGEVTRFDSLKIMKLLK